MNNPEQAPRRGVRALALAAIGVVYGDIGTSPLYAFKEAFAPQHGLEVSEPHVLAALSSLFWAVTIVISVKYVGVVLRYDNAGEGGVLALTALAHRLSPARARWTAWIIGAGVFAAALFYGDALITPAISVLSAVEGIEVATPQFADYVIPVTLGIIIGLFLIQRVGTGRVGALFGPVTLVWFLSIAALGAISIADTPMVLLALNPAHAWSFAVQEPGAAFVLLSAVFLALTGGEALYADMGHFGARPVRLAWYGVVCPSLLVNYFGQGALVLRSAEAARNPFYLLAPDWFLFPLVVLATLATVIASQATITGAYSMTLQASRLGYLPRVHAVHTSDTERGQIYVPAVNWLMLIGVLWLVLEFRSSGALAAAYGIAVSGTMIITTLLTLCITWMASTRWRLSLLGGLALFGALELLFFASNLTKFASGGWLPLALGLLIYILLTTWHKGSGHVAAQRRRIDIAMADFLANPAPEVPRVRGTAVYLSSDPTLVPSALFHSLKHYQVMHEQMVFLNVVTEEVPWVDPEQRAVVRLFAPSIYGVTLHFGFREEPDVPAALETVAAQGLQMEAMLTTFFVTRSLIVERPGTMSSWRGALFGWMMRQSESAASYFRLPANRVVELGTQVIL